ncbi:MAG: hypothetical protein ThorAB25_14170 [Candidatus Thorarchaeota archaeon AB_25]|nr:MAG: hypothetical protein ThorAB25_14170 [Candidatus Thorarchaeota archaeon AB_25]
MLHGELWRMGPMSLDYESGEKAETLLTFFLQVLASISIGPSGDQNVVSVTLTQRES